MPRSYGGYTSQQDPGGNPWYNPLMSTPDWGAGIRSVLNSMWGYKQQKQKEEEERRKAEAEAAKEQRALERQAKIDALNEKKTLADIGYTESQTEENKRKGLTPPPVDRSGLKTIMRSMGVPPEQVDTIDAISDVDLAKVKDNLLGRYADKPDKPEKADKPTEHDKKVMYWGGKLQKGEINQAQFEEYVWGGKPSSTPEKPLADTASGRQANMTLVSGWYSEGLKNKTIKSAKNVIGYDTGRVRKIAEAQGGRATAPNGFLVDVPFVYNAAKLSVADGFPTPQDKKLVDSTDAMFEVFQSRIKPTYPTFDAFMKASDPFASSLKKDKDFNINLLKDWYEIYRQR